jgi:hypothetical protein
MLVKYMSMLRTWHTVYVRTQLNEVKPICVRWMRGSSMYPTAILTLQYLGFRRRPERRGEGQYERVQVALSLASVAGEGDGGGGVIGVEGAGLLG